MSPTSSHTGNLDDTHPAPVEGPRAGDARFAIPPATHVVSRPRLYVRLTEGLESALTLVAAPAGWGKTLLVGSWLADGGAGRPAAWITLGPEENDIRTLWVTIATALSPVVGDRAAAELSRVVTEENLEDLPGRVAAVLAGAGTPLVLVLDNLHELTSLAVHESLLRLVQRPPEGLHLVATTRRDTLWPMHRLRLAGALHDVRATDIAFRVDEAAALFAQLGVELDSTRVGQLVAKTDGWAAGLRLAALQLHVSDDPEGFVDAFSGDDHAVAAYLLSEVIDRQPPELLDFLVRVSVLDLVSADLADALTGARTGATTLAELAASNLFVQATGPGGRWYRLHRLIADVLRTRIPDARTFRDIHRRAADWFRAQSMPLEAVRYAVRGGLWPLAADLLGVHAIALVVRGTARELDVILTAAPRDQILSHPELAAALAAARIYQGLSTEVPELTAAGRGGVDDVVPGPRADRLRMVLDLVELGATRARGDLVALAEVCRRIPHDPHLLIGLGLASWDVVPVLVLGNAGTAALWNGDHVAAEKNLRAAIDSNQSRGMLRPHLNAAAHLTLLESERGDLDAAESGARAVVDSSVAAGLTVAPQVVTAYLALARVALERDDPVAFDRWIGRVQEVEAIAPEPHVQVAAAAMCAMRRADAGDREGALAELLRTTGRLLAGATPVLADRLLLVEADLLRRTGDVDRAIDTLARLCGPPRPHIAYAYARLRLGAGDIAAAIEVMKPYPVERATVRHRVEGGIIHTLIAATGDRHHALDPLEDALLAAAPLGLRRPFLVEASELAGLLGERIEAGTGAAAFAVDLVRRMTGGPAAAPAMPLVALTEREHVVLRYMASTLSNAEIAAELYLSVNTIKSHQRMVYRKLGAEGRRDAVRRARELRIL